MPCNPVYLLLNNQTDEIISTLQDNMVGEIILQRRANNEQLMVLRFSHRQ